jgi:lysophospholipase L1-like esterase
MRYLALGDSYTIGEAVHAAERFPEQLAAALRAAGLALDPYEIVAQTGWTTDELAAALRTNLPQGPYDLVTLLIGVNNQYRGRTPQDYKPEFVALLEKAIGWAGNRPDHVIVVSIPDWGVTPFGKDRRSVGAEIDAFNAVNRAEAARLGAHYVDITPLSRQAREDRTLTAEDGLHPSGKMYARWVERIAPVARGVLGEKLKAKS